MEQKSKDTFYLDPDYENFVPRKTRLKYETVGKGIFEPLFLLIIGCIVGSFAFILAAAIYNDLRSYWQYEVNGLETTATITSCELVKSSSSTNQLNITYIYTVSNIDYTANDVVVRHNAYCGQFLAETQVDVQYAVNNPTHSQMVQSSFEGSIAPIILCVIPMFLFVFISGIWNGLILEIYARYKYHQLRSKGVVLEGEVVNAEYVKQQLRYGHRFVLTITTEFETPAGRTLTRKFRDAPIYSNTKTREIPTEGTRVMFLYANDRAVIML